MKGLLVKDMRILLRMKTSLVVIIALGVFMSLNNGNPSFSLGYMMVVSSMLVVNTISYDYFEKGMNFILTLPIRRRDYVLEKYLLTLLVEFGVALIAVVIQLVSMALNGPADWGMFVGTGIACIFAATLLMAMYIPVNLKFGPEKSRIALLIIVGGIALISYVVYKVELLQKLLMNMVESLSTMTAIQVVGVFVAVWVLIMAASIAVSIRILEKKEF